MLEQSFTAGMPLMMATSAIGSGRRLLEFSMALSTMSLYHTTSIPYQSTLLPVLLTPF